MATFSTSCGTSTPKPRLSDLRETGAIEQDADVVLFIYREKERGEAVPKNIAEIIIAKHRNGPVGAVKLYFDSQKVSFRNLEKEELAGLEESSEDSVITSEENF